MAAKRKRSIGLRMRGPTPKTKAVWDELNRQTPRGLVIVAAALIDERLRELLEAKIVNNKKIACALLADMGPLGALSARNHVAYAFGLIGKGEHDDIDAIRRLRNDFAHSTHAVAFKSPNVAQKCQSVAVLKDIDKHRPAHLRQYLRASRGRFMTAVAVIAYRLRERAQKEKRIEERRAPLPYEMESWPP